MNRPGWSWAISIPEFCRVVSLSLTIMLCPPAKRRWTIFAQNIRFTRQLRPLISLEFSGASEPASPDAGYNCIPFSRDRRSQSVYQFNRGPKPTLPVEVFGYALKRYWDGYASEQGTLSFETVLYGPGSPGAAFKLTESSLALLLDALPSWMGFRYDETAGLRVLLRSNSVRSIKSITNLERYYEKRKREDVA